MALPYTASFAGASGALPDPPFLQCNPDNVNRDGSGNAIASVATGNYTQVLDDSNGYGNAQKSTITIGSFTPAALNSVVAIVNGYASAPGTSTGLTGGYRFVSDGSGTTALQLINNGVSTLASANTTTFTAGDTFEIANDGSGNITVKKNGTTITALSVTDTTISGGNAGFGFNEVGTGGNHPKISAWSTDSTAASLPATDGFVGVAATLPNPVWAELSSGDVLVRDGSGNAANSGSFSASKAYVAYDGGAFPANQSSQVTAASTVASTGGFNYIYVGVRMQGVDSSAKGYFLVSDGESDTRVIKIVNNVTTTLATDNSFVWALGDVLKLQVIGPQLSVWKNGALRAPLTVLDSTLIGGQPGFGLQFNSGATGPNPKVTSFVGDQATAAVLSGVLGTSALGTLKATALPARGFGKKRRRESSTFDYTARGWFDVVMEKAGLFDRDLINASVSSQPTLSGVVGTSATGTLTPNISVGLTGVAGTSATGQVADADTNLLSGVVGTGATGTLTPNVTVALTGVVGTGATGTLVPGISDALTGVEGDTSTGTLGVAFAVPIAGVEGESDTGTMTPPGGTPLNGVEGDTAEGTLAVSITVALTGVEGDSATGTITTGSDETAALTGVEGDTATGTLTPNITIALAGVEGDSATGVTTVPGDKTAALTGVGAVGQTGTLVPSGVAFNPLDPKYQGRNKRKQPNITFKPLPKEEAAALEEAAPSIDPATEIESKPVPEGTGISAALLDAAPVPQVTAIKPPDAAPPEPEEPEPVAAAPDKPKPDPRIAQLEADAETARNALASAQVDWYRAQQKHDRETADLAAKLQSAIGEMAQIEDESDQLRATVAAHQATEAKLQRELKKLRSTIAAMTAEQLLLDE